MSLHDNGAAVPTPVRDALDQAGDRDVMLVAVWAVRLLRYVPVFLYADPLDHVVGHFRRTHGSVHTEIRFPTHDLRSLAVFEYVPDGGQLFEAVGALGLNRRGLVDPWGGPSGEDEP